MSLLYCKTGTGIRAGTQGTPVFECTLGENVGLDQLCDGNRDCGAGDDEITPLCESIRPRHSSYTNRLLTVTKTIL